MQPDIGLIPAHSCARLPRVAYLSDDDDDDDDDDGGDDDDDKLAVQYPSAEFLHEQGRKAKPGH